VPQRFENRVALVVDNPNMTVDSATAGSLTNALNQRRIQFALKFYFCA
jgi:hypothetical protein